MTSRSRYEKMLEKYHGLNGMGKKKFLNRVIKILQARGEDSENELALARQMLSKIR